MGSGQVTIGHFLGVLLKNKEVFNILEIFRSFWQSIPGKLSNGKSTKFQFEG